MGLLNKTFVLQEECSAPELRLFHGGGWGPSLIRGLIASVVPIAGVEWFLSNEIRYTDVTAVVLWCVGFLLWDRFEIRVRVEDDRALLWMRPLLFDWLAPSVIDLEGVTAVKTWMYAPFLFLYRGEDWHGEFIPPPFMSIGSGATAHERIAQFIEETVIRKDDDG